MSRNGRAARTSDLLRARSDENPRSGVSWVIMKKGDVVEFKFNM